jgi:hypothetical protein
MDYHLNQQFLTNVGIKFKDILNMKAIYLTNFCPVPTTAVSEKLCQNCEQENIPQVSFCIVITLL